MKTATRSRTNGRKTALPTRPTAAVASNRLIRALFTGRGLVLGSSGIPWNHHEKHVAISRNLKTGFLRCLAIAMGQCHSSAVQGNHPNAPSRARASVEAGWSTPKKLR